MVTTFPTVFGYEHVFFIAPGKIINENIPKVNMKKRKTYDTLSICGTTSRTVERAILIGWADLLSDLRDFNTLKDRRSRKVLILWMFPDPGAKVM
jgi:hypothetical protein